MNQLILAATGDVVVQHLLVRSTFAGRLRGLLFCRCLQPGSAMLLINTKKIHTFGVTFPLDLYFFNNTMHLIGSLHNVPPWRVPLSPERTRHILETSHLDPVDALKLEVGDQVSVRWGLRG